MNPITPILLLLGYGISLPIGAQLSKVYAAQNRLAMLGHQFGVGIATLGWVASGRWIMVLLHVAWLVGTRFWFWVAGKDKHAPETPS